MSALPPSRTLCSVVNGPIALRLHEQRYLPANLLDPLGIPLLVFADSHRAIDAWARRLRALGRGGRWQLVVFELDTPEGIEAIETGPLAPGWRLRGALSEDRTLNGLQLQGEIDLDTERWEHKPQTALYPHRSTRRSADEEPPMPVDVNALLERLRPALAKLGADLLQRAADPGVADALAAEHAKELAARRTADPVEVWTGFRVQQIAAAWVLSLLFVRTLEDRGLVPLRLKDSKDHREQLRALAPYLGDRDYLLLVFRELAHYKGVRDVFDAEHNPVWTLAPSAEAAAELLEFAGGERGLGGLDLSGDTRFLGDVYERLDEGVRERYALLQTPDFVESFILDRTLAPALTERPLRELAVLDPTCGSGHFLLGAFHRLRAAWEAAEPAAGPEVWAFSAIHQVYGVDINPYAVAIARFRLVLAYLDAAKIRDLSAARDLRLKVAVADSLLPVEGAQQQELASVETRPEARAKWNANPFAFAQSPEAREVLGGQRFDVVVGNPPYITVKDDALRETYRAAYTTASGKFQLVVPFVQCFFGLAKQDGWVGAIVGNGFMKREFGKKLIEEFLANIDLTQVIDTSGAYIPGHGTPTVLLFGRKRPPQADKVLAVMGKRGEPSTPEDPAKGLVWSSIRDHHADVGHDDDYLSVDEIDRQQLAVHPWALKGGGADKLKALLEERAEKVLGSVATDIGFDAIMGEDDIYIADGNVWGRRRVVADRVQTMVEGTAVRDWSISTEQTVYFPYAVTLEPMDLSSDQAVFHHLWPFKTRLINRMQFGKNTLEAGLQWFEYRSFYKAKRFSPLSITFPFVATHNHFVLDRGGKVFKQTAPIIKLPPDATEDDHLALLGYLNSSTACFWMKQVFFCKGAQGVNEGIRTAAWMQFYEHDGTKLRGFPVPKGSNSQIILFAGALDSIGRRKTQDKVSDVINSATQTSSPLRSSLQARRASQMSMLRQMIWLQEELDWHIYADFGICEIGLTDPYQEGHELYEFGRLVDRKLLSAAIAGDDEAESWIRVHGWSVEEARTHQNRPLTAIEVARTQALTQNQGLRLCEDPNHKRRWYRPDFEKEEQDGLRTWLLDRIESELSTNTETKTVRQLARALHRDPKVLAVAEVYSNQPEPDLERLFTELVGTDAVPHLAAYRYKPEGLIKFRAWEATWEAQRAEDVWEATPLDKRGERPEVPLPPKYDSKDFLRPEYWSLRGKLDVPKERFISYPDITEEDDPTPVLGWAGWDAADRMAALAALLERQADPELRKPLLAGMAELLPWVVQWHGADDRYGTPLGELWTGHLQGTLAAEGLTLEGLRAWAPEKKVGRKSAKREGETKEKAPKKAREELGRDALLEAFAALDGGEGVERNALATQLGASTAAVGKLAERLVDEGVWEVRKKRPLTYGARSTAARHEEET